MTPAPSLTGSADEAVGAAVDVSADAAVFVGVSGGQKKKKVPLEPNYKTSNGKNRFLFGFIRRKQMDYS